MGSGKIHRLLFGALPCFDFLKGSTDEYVMVNLGSQASELSNIQAAPKGPKFVVGSC